MDKIDWSQVMKFTAMDGVKLVLSAVIIVLVTKLQVVSDKLSALLIALPLTSLLAMIWMRGEGQENSRIANHAESTFWFVLPTMPMFLVLPWMLRQGWGFSLSLFLNCVLTGILFWLLVWVGRKFGINFY